MSERLRVLAKGRGRVSVVGAARGSSEARMLENWLSERIDVVHFEQRTRTNVIDIRYDDAGALAGRFVRSLKERLVVFERSRTKPEPFDVEATHSLPGRVRLRVTGVDERRLSTLTMLTAGLPGVKRTEHVPSGATMLVRYDPREVTEVRIIEAIWRSDPADWDREWHRPAPIRWLGAVTGTSVLLMCVTRAAPLPWLAAGITVNALRPLARSVAALRRGRISIDLLDVAATFAALVTGMPTTAAFVIWMVGVGDLLLDLSANNARSALSTVMRRGERQVARVRDDGQVEEIPIGDLAVGDRFVVHTGHGVSADGEVVSGLAEVDEKALTGESRLLSKRPGDDVFASSVVVEGHLVVEVRRSGKDTEAAKVERILNTVGSKPLTLQRDALEFAGKLVLPTFGVAWLAAALSSEVSRGVCVLITDFGTGIRIAVPATAMAAVALAAREGVLVKGAQYLERLAKTDVIVFDKTGTLTNGTPEVVDVVTVRGVRESTLIAWCASAEARYDHPVARAVKARAKEMAVELVAPEPGSEEYAVGLGVSARLHGRRVRVGRAEWMKTQGLDVGAALERHLTRFKKARRSSLCVAFDDRVVGLVAYSDGTRPESAAMVRALRDGGRRRVVLLSGDSPEVVKNVARAVGIDDAVGGLLPEEKAAYVKRLKKRGHVVAMVGDGINDAPALALADVGISMAGSTDVALETADVVLLGGGLSRLENAFRIGERGMSSVRRGLGAVVVPNAIAIALGAFGLITPPIAAVINNGATLLAVLVGTVPLLVSRGRRPAELTDGDVLEPTAESPTPRNEARHPARLLRAG